MYNQHTRGMATTRHRSLVERGERKILPETSHTPKKIQENPIFTNLKKRFKHVELPIAKLFEGIIVKRLAQYIEQHSTLTDNQLGFLVSK